MRFFVLASGSKGNCILIKTGKSNLLIDCGISVKKIRQALEIHNLLIEDIDGVLVTHGHSDHIRSLKAFSNITKIYISGKLYFELIKKKDLCRQNIIAFENTNKFYIKDIFVQVIPVSHDCIDPVGFILFANNEKIGVFTDIGEVTEKVLNSLSQCSVILIEANHDVEMLINCGRPQFLKNRILCPQGHLSNRDAGRLLAQVYDEKYLKEVVLMHLSEDCNCPETAVNTIKDELQKLNIIFSNIKISSKVC